MQDTRLQDYKIARRQKTTDYKITKMAFTAWGPRGPADIEREGGYPHGDPSCGGSPMGDYHTTIT